MGEQDLRQHAEEQGRLYETPAYQQYLDDLLRWALEVVDDAIERRLQDGGGRRAELTGRTKDPASFRQKAAKPRADDPTRPKYLVACETITDQVGLRVVTHLMGDIAPIGEALKSDGRLSVGEEVDKTTEARVNRQFGYAALHLVFRPAPGCDAPQPPAGRFPAHVEVQLRTAMADVWSVAEHGARYKSALPLEISRKFDSAAALIDVADALIQEAVDGARRARRLTDPPATPHDRRALDEDELQNVLDRLFPGAPRATRAGALSWMVGNLRAVGLETVEDLLETMGRVPHDAVDRAFAREGHLHRDQVRRLDDALVSVAGRRYVEAASQSPEGSSDAYRNGRPGILRWRYIMLRKAGALADADG